MPEACQKELTNSFYAQWLAIEVVSFAANLVVISVFRLGVSRAQLHDEVVS